MLAVDNINVSISGVTVLRGVSLELKAGVTTVLLGRNGAGKTTTLRSIMGLLALQSGSVRLENIRLDESPAHLRAHQGIGYAPEDRRIVPNFTVEENITLPALSLRLSNKERDQRLNEIYELIPLLKEMKDRPGGSVSGGQGKIVALGRALMIARKVLLLDEPFQGLAPALSQDYARTLDKIRKSTNLALLVTESTPALLDEIADETIHIERGAII